MRGDVGALRDRVSTAILAAVPGLPSDDEASRAFELSVEANIVDVLAVLADPDLPIGIGVPPDSLTFATAMVRRGAPPADLVHAYLIGQNELWRAWLEAVGAHMAPGPELLAVLEVSSERVFSRADCLVAGIMRHVERERERWIGTALARRSQVVHGLLAGEETGVAEASRELGYDIDRWVLAAVLWDDVGEGREEDGLEADAALAARAAGAGRAFTFAPGDTSLWAWIATSEEPDLEQVSAALSSALPDAHGVALGVPARGLEGFRLGHREALDARRVAELGEGAGVVRYDEVETLALLSADLEAMARFVQRTLGGLAAGDDSTARLRQTLLAWLAEGGNARRAAERLHAHKNTVLYRLQRAQDLLGRALDDDRGDLELALTAMERLGPRAIAPNG
jgi:DNA-binding PucR family transcriptional regulator